MTEAARLLAEVASAGTSVMLDGDGRKVRGATALPDSLVQDLRTHRDEIRQALAPRRQNIWPRDIQEIIDWFLKFQPPQEPFQMRPGVTIAAPARYWKYIQGDIASGPKAARAQTGAFQADLRRLHKLFASGREAA